MTRWKKVALAALVVTIVVMVMVLGGGWYLSNLLKDGGLVPDHDDTEYTLEVAAIGEGNVTLIATSDTEEDGDWTSDGLFGLEREDGYDQVGAIIEIRDEQVVREFSPISGGLEVGDTVELDAFVFPENPQEAFDIPFQEVFYSSSLGEFPAWIVGGPSDTWVIFVHGKDSERREALRIIPTALELGLRSMVITYRNDEDVPENPDGYHRYGQSEWEDLEGAAAYAIENDAEGLILVGYSMGGAIVTNFLYRSAIADSVDGAILDAPMLDFSATVDLGAREGGYPVIAAKLAKLFAGFRFDIDWGKLDYLERIDELHTPILLFHGDDDDTVPVESSDFLAETRADIVTYVRVPDTGHVHSWNTDRAAYEAAVTDFLQGLAR